MSAARPIVIAAHDGLDRVTRPFADRVWIRAIAHQIAQAQNPVIVARRAGEHGLERLQVSVDIAKDQVRHSFSSATSGVDPSRTGTPMVPIPRET